MSKTRMTETQRAAAYEIVALEQLCAMYKGTSRAHRIDAKRAEIARLVASNSLTSAMLASCGVSDTRPLMKSGKRDDLGQRLYVCGCCAKDVENVTPVDVAGFRAMAWVPGKGYARVAETARRVCRDCVRG